MSTAGTLLDLGQEKAKIDRADIGLAGLESTHLLHVVDQLDRKYQKAFRRGGEAKRVIYSEDGGTIPSKTNLAADVAKDATSLSVDSISGATSGGGAARIFDQNMSDIWEYTNGSSKTITGVTGINFAHEEDDSVHWLQKLPSNFGDFRSTQDSEDGVMVNGLPYRFITGDPDAREFSVYESSTGIYLIFPRGLTGDYHVRYNKTGTTIDEESDSVTVPIEDEDYITFGVAEHILLIVDANLYSVRIADFKRQKATILSNSLKERNLGRALRIVKRRLPRPYYNDPSLYRA